MVSRFHSSIFNRGAHQNLLSVQLERFLLTGRALAGATNLEPGMFTVLHVRLRVTARLWLSRSG